MTLSYQQSNIIDPFRSRQKAEWDSLAAERGVLSWYEMQPAGVYTCAPRTVYTSLRPHVSLLLWQL